jgi:putative DNA primase/helicase
MNDDELAAVARKAQQQEKRQRKRDQQTKPRAGPNGHDDDDTIRRLAAMPALDYERVRDDEAEHLGCRVGILDKLVGLARGDGADTKGLGRPLVLPAPKPSPHRVDGAALLQSLADYFSRHLVLPTGADHAMALWAVHTHCSEVFDFTPRLQFKAPTKNAGKSTAMALLKGVVLKPLETESISQAFLYRAIELAHPTVLMDEADTYLRDDDDLRAMVNAGVKPGAQAGRCVGDNQEPRLFDCHSPMALSGIGNLPGTIEDRAVKVMMRRRRRSETIQPIDETTHAVAERLASEASRWAKDHRDTLRALRPDMGSLINRAADRWRPLYAIADLAGGEWPELARAAQAAISGADDDDADSLGERLLADVKRLFEDVLLATELSTADLVERLVQMAHRPWPEMGRTRKPLTAARFTQMVGKFGVLRRRFWVDGKAGPWGYRLTDFEDAFGRYLGA